MYVSISKLRCVINVPDLFYQDSNEYSKLVSAGGVETGDRALLFSGRISFKK